MIESDGVNGVFIGRLLFLSGLVPHVLPARGLFAWPPGHATYSNLPWPTGIVHAGTPLPSMTIDIVRTADCTFSVGTGLGWDKLHPRALVRCSDVALKALVRLFVLAALLGRWLRFVGFVVVGLIPKPDGGRRPIGLLPSLVRL